MDAVHRVRLRVVPVDDIRPHEIADPGREARIFQRLQTDGVLRDPLMAGEVMGVSGYFLLDGTNRRRALSELGISYVVTQVVDYSDEHAVQLRTWCHSTGRALADLLREAATIPDASVVPLSPLGEMDALRTPGTLAVLLTGSKQYALRRDIATETARAVQLRDFVDLYESTLTRVDCNPDDLEDAARNLNPSDTLVAFPPFSRSEVVAMALRGILIPAGITRHVILCGRALRINVPLDLLAGSRDPAEANAALQEHLAIMHPRFYQEPTLLFDS